jgi:hypothetical protein
MGSQYSEQKPSAGFLIVDESSLGAIPSGACVRVQTASYSQLQAGDYIVISSEGKMLPRRFVKLSVEDGATGMLVVDGHNQQQSIPFPRLVGLVCGVKHDGEAYNPNPQSFLQRAAFRLRHTLGGNPAA